jgi:hypothetical protein
MRASRPFQPVLHPGDLGVALLDGVRRLGGGGGGTGEVSGQLVGGPTQSLHRVVGGQRNLEDAGLGQRLPPDLRRPAFPLPFVHLGRRRCHLRRSVRQLGTQPPGALRHRDPGEGGQGRSRLLLRLCGSGDLALQVVQLGQDHIQPVVEPFERLHRAPGRSEGVAGGPGQVVQAEPVGVGGRLVLGGPATGLLADPFVHAEVQQP